MSRVVGFAVAVAALGLVGCAATAPSPPAGGVGSDPAGTATPVALASASATARPTEVPGPPVASIVLGDAPVAAELGSFSWDGLTSDAPWLIPREVGSAVAGQTLDVALEPDVVPAAWTAIWAPIRNGAATEDGRVSVAGSGPIAGTLRTPPDPGDWSLSLSMRFEPGRSGTWYWHVAVEP